MQLLEDHLNTNEYKYLGTVETRKHRDEFGKVKDALISEWEEHTGQLWPRYTSEVLSKTGVCLRRVGQPYDAHHLIENSYGGEAEWWNIHPAKYPEEHQAGIHGVLGLARNIFKRWI